VIAITGGSGEVSQQVALNLLRLNQDFRLYGRSETVRPEISKHYVKIENYRDLKIDSETDSLLVTNGSFIFKNFDELDVSEIDTLIDSNFYSVIKIIWEFLRVTRSDRERNIYVIGSTAAYDLGPKAALYGSCKVALKGLLQALNKEYAQTDTRFTLISFSTVDNKMGRKVPDQSQPTLLNIQDVADEITERIIRRKNFYEPEVILRRRFIQEHRK
jgi:short-subunit dehydrogenase